MHLSFQHLWGSEKRFFPPQSVVNSSPRPLSVPFLTSPERMGMTPSEALKLLLCQDIHLFLLLSFQSDLTGFGMSKHISVTVNTTEPRTLWTSKLLYKPLPYVSSKALPLPGFRTFITRENVGYSAGKNVPDIRPAIKMNFKDEYQVTENKTFQTFNKCGILNLAFPNQLVFQRLLFFIKALNRTHKLYERA